VTMIQLNPIVSQVGGHWFDGSGKVHHQQRGRVKAMTIRASIARQYGAEDPATRSRPFPCPRWTGSRSAARLSGCHPIPPAAIKSQNPVMESEGYFLPVQMAGVTPDKRYTTCYGFNFVVNARAPKDKQEALHDMLHGSSCRTSSTAGRRPARSRSPQERLDGRPAREELPARREIIQSQGQRRLLPAHPIWTELADAMHRAVQKVMLNNADIKARPRRAAAEVDRATAEFKKPELPLADPAVGHGLRPAHDPLTSSSSSTAHAVGNGAQLHHLRHDEAARWVGLENYESISAIRSSAKALANTLVYIAGSTIFITLVGSGSRWPSTRGAPGGASA